MAACAMPGTAVDVPDSAGRIGVVNLGDVEDCDVTLGYDVVIDLLVIGSNVGPMHAPTHRLRVRGGTIAAMLLVGGSTDIVFDGTIFDNGALPSAGRPAGGMYLPAGESPDEIVERFAVVNSILRAVAVNGGADGAIYTGRARDVLFANNNVVTGGNVNAWAFRLGGGENILLVDNTVRVSFHKLVRMNDAPVDYVYIRGGTWMREATPTPDGMIYNDSFAQLAGSTTDRVYIHDPVVYLLPDTWVTFGMSIDMMQVGRRWEARRIEWHALGAHVISDELMQNQVDACDSIAAECDYGIGTHTYLYDPALAFPEDPWRDLPAIDPDDPDALPIAP